MSKPVSRVLPAVAWIAVFAIILGVENGLMTIQPTSAVNAQAGDAEPTPEPRLLSGAVIAPTGDRGSTTARAAEPAEEWTPAPLPTFEQRPLPTETPDPTPEPEPEAPAPTPAPVAAAPAPPPPPTPAPQPAAPPPPEPEPIAASGGGSLGYPVDGSLSQGFSGAHPAIDIYAPTGTAVVSPCDGSVTYAGWKDNGGGNVVDIACDNGLVVSLNHLDGVSIGVGAGVARGTLVGSVGMTGVATGPHVHFGALSGGTWVDPLAYM